MFWVVLVQQEINAGLFIPSEPWNVTTKRHINAHRSDQSIFDAAFVRQLTGPRSLVSLNNFKIPDLLPNNREISAGGTKPPAALYNHPSSPPPPSSLLGLELELELRGKQAC